MKYFCTVVDKNFLSRLQALNYSLRLFNKNYKLLTLCIDFIPNIPKTDNLIFFHLTDLLSNDKNLALCQNNQPSKEALINRSFDEAKRVQFIWSLSPYFTNFCLNLDYVKEDILYIDADIYFFNNWESIYNQNNIDIGLVEHRMPWTGNSGKYNVGIVYFKKNTNGIKCSNFWKNCLLDPSNAYYENYGGCGDQKYLELFPLLYPNVFSLDHYIGHLAPWNLQHHQYTENQIIWNNKQQDVLYYHFSNFYYDDNKFIPAPRHNINDVSSVPLLQKLHETYYKTLKQYA